ncbi:tetratricopeptide repeat protein [Amycolatopsis vancoresmycina]|uniref:Uncharacterized protein n=1 Tax=Amycolatopsis vancoresmycina DSM 44592 TaxID=1292037 RepID=R1HE21_9PSEU|nr:tetratricopeptide repeat protein [Amycolatopsis vancoresmycina]EOD58676.1 hypothetical protein H480_42895 [Amycolatopsis vancoresmycina DSM 44592]
MSDSFADLDAALGRFDGAAALAACEQLGADGSAHTAAGRVRALWLLRRWDEGRAELAKLSAVWGSVEVELARGIVALGQPDDPMLMAFDCGAALRDPDRALVAFRSASELDPANAEALAGQATALRMAGRVDEAERLLDHADPAARTSPAVLVEHALCLAERGETVVAPRLAAQALEFDPGDVRAAIVRSELLRIGRNTSVAAASADDLRTRFPDHAGALEARGWIAADAGAYEAASPLFRDSMSMDPSRPGAVLGAVTCLLMQGDLPVAKLLSETALQRDPSSPQLNLCRVRVLTADDAPPPKIIEAYRRTLDLDPRMLRARLELALTLIDLNRRAEARDVIAVLGRQYPHHPDTVAASTWLDVPWRMPAPSVIRTRIHRPWQEGRDRPDQVLEHLIGEVAQNWRLSRTAADRLRDRVEQDRTTVLEQAFTYEQVYLRSRNSYQNVARRGWIGRSWRLAGYLLIGLGVTTTIASMPWLIWLIARGAGLPNRLAEVFVAGVPLILAGFVFTRPSSRPYPRVFGLDPIELLTALFMLSLPPAAIWQSIAWFGPGRGIIIGLLLVAAVAVLYKVGKFLSVNVSLEERLAQSSFDQWLEYLYGATLLPLAAEVGEVLVSPYGTVLPSSSKIVSEAVVDIDTPATKELRQLLRQRSKGSFALAGPRGAGKSTLLERWCAGQLLRESGTQEARMDLTVRVDAPVGYQSKDFLTHLFGRLCDEVENYAADHDPAINSRASRTADGSAQSGLLRLFHLIRGTWVERERRPGQGVLTAPELLHLARSERNKLRFLQSHTTEGEVSLGAPALSGTALKRKSSVKRDDIPLNHPQLVDRFRAFLGVAAEVVRNLDGKVLIGIDELDRISDGEGAQQFLNELKAVFNVPNCYFLVSVSEDALADFELSAMGMRTVFDSAFDTIVRVDYLTFDQAKLLLNRGRPAGTVLRPRLRRLRWAGAGTDPAQRSDQ